MLATPTLTSAPLNPASDIVNLSVYRVPPLPHHFFFLLFIFIHHEDRPSGKEEGRSNVCRNGDRVNRIDVRFNVGHPVDIYSSVYSCPVFRYDVFLLIISSSERTARAARRNELLLAITLWRNLAPNSSFCEQKS